ncbi:MAG TPA: mucoidy inhibitor MuiA family protein, partial [Phaeodactylibacter sp.]|nr:mucoidy inhibitor MuiA family protein [Phaeodactylibacter sp.]
NEQIKNLKKEILYKKADIEVTLEQIKLIIANKKVSGQNGLEASKIKSVADFYHAELTRLKHQKIEQEAVLDSLNNRLKQLSLQWGYMPSNTKANERAEISIEIYVDRAMTSEILLAYYVNNVTWSTQYDINVADLNSPLELVYKAQVNNNSGVDWEEVRLSFSTAKLNRSNVLPKLNPWWLRFDIPEAYLADVVLSESSNMRPQMRSRHEDDTAGDGSYLPPSQVKENFTSLVFTMEKNYSIPSDGKYYTLDLKTQSAEATYTYHCRPQYSPHAYLIANIKDWSHLNLSQGYANIYFENTYQGKTFIDPLSVEDELTLSIGTDIAVNIERERVQDFTKKKFIGTKKKEWAGYRIKLKNNKSQKINIVVKDRFPLSTDSDIEIEYLDWSGADFDKDTGFLTWKLELQPGQAKELTFSFSVKYPKKKRLVF